MKVAACFLLITGLISAQQRMSPFDVHLASGKAALQQSRYGEADRELRAAIDATKQLDPADPMTATRTANALDTLGDLDLLMGKYDEAVSLEEQAVAGIEKAAGADSAELSPHLIRLAGAYRSGSQTAKAEPVLQRALTLDVRAVGPDDERVASDYDNLASVYMEMKQMPDARGSYEKALQSRINRLGMDNTEVAGSYVNLGVLDEKDNNLKAARDDYEKALAISEKKLGDESYGLTGILDRLGMMLRKQKNYNDAAPYLQRSLSIREKTLGARHSDVAPALDNLALTYFGAEKYAEAEPLFVRSMQIWLATQGPQSPFYALALDNLGSLYSAQRRYADAEPLFKKALGIRESSDMESVYNLALIYEVENDPKAADLFFQRAILLGEKGMGTDHREELPPVLEAYETFLKATGRLADAKKVAARRQELNEKKDVGVGRGAAGAGRKGGS